MTVSYECVAKALLQAEADLESEFLEYPNVSVLPGSKIDILEAREVDDQIRVRCERGWTSVADESGSTQLVPFHGERRPSTQASGEAVASSAPSEADPSSELDIPALDHLLPDDSTVRPTVRSMV